MEERYCGCCYFVGILTIIDHSHDDVLVDDDHPTDALLRWPESCGGDQNLCEVDGGDGSVELERSRVGEDYDL